MVWAFSSLPDIAQLLSKNDIPNYSHTDLSVVEISVLTWCKQNGISLSCYYIPSE